MAAGAQQPRWPPSHLGAQIRLRHPSSVVPGVSPDVSPRPREAAPSTQGSPRPIGWWCWDQAEVCLQHG